METIFVQERLVNELLDSDQKIRKSLRKEVTIHYYHHQRFFKSEDFSAGISYLEMDLITIQKTIKKSINGKALSTRSNRKIISGRNKQRPTGGNKRGEFRSNVGI